MNWNKVFSEMKACHMQQLILQWSRHGVVDFLKDDTWLRTILESAHQYGIQVIIGLYGDNQYFKVIENAELDLSGYFKSLFAINQEQAHRVYQIAQDYESFAGWYLTEEIDDLHFQTLSRQELLKAYLQNMAVALACLSDHPLYLSGFYSNQTSPQEYAKVFGDITQKKYRILLQSGIGAQLVDFQESREYLTAFRKLFGTQCIPVVEAFAMREENNITTMDFALFNRQMALVQEGKKEQKIALFSLRYFQNKRFLTEYRKHYCY